MDIFGESPAHIYTLDVAITHGTIYKVCADSLQIVNGSLCIHISFIVIAPKELKGASMSFTNLSIQYLQ